METLTKKEIIEELERFGINTFPEILYNIREYRQYYFKQNICENEKKDIANLVNYVKNLC